MKLAGLTVLDFTQFMAGPMAGSILADHGATVIKIEPPAGDPVRNHGVHSRPGQRGSDTFRALNRGKRSVVLDLKDPAHREAARRLIVEADVLIESFRPGVADRLGIGWGAASASNPELVYCSISAFGQSGTRKDLAAHDTAVQALAGAFAHDAEGRPVEPAVSLASVTSAQLAVSAILMALLARPVQGGEHIDIAMYDALLAVRGGLGQAALAALDAPASSGGQASYALSACYQASDGRWLRVDARDRNAARVLLEALALTDWLPAALDPAGPQAALREALAAGFLLGSQAHWLERPGSTGGIAPVVNYAEALAHEHTASRGMIAADAEGGWHLSSPIRFLCSPASADFDVPVLGEGTCRMLEDVGYSAAEIAALVRLESAG